MKVVWTIFGGLGGSSIEGHFDSGGLEQLDEELRRLPDTFVQPPVGWDQWPSVAVSMQKIAPTQKSVLIGFSGGGSRGTWLCNALMRPVPTRVDLFVAIDPSPSWQMEPIHTNVKKCLCFHNTMPLMLGLGGGQVTGITHIETIQIAEQHLFVDWNPYVHEKIVEEVRAL